MRQPPRWMVSGERNRCRVSERQTSELSKSAQGGTAAGETGFDGAEVDVEDFGDLFVGESFDLAEDDDGAEGLRELAQGGFDALANFGLGGVIEGGIAVVGERCAEAETVAFVVGVGLIGRVDRDLLLFMARPPAPLIGGLAKSDAVEPGAEAGFAMEAADAAEDLDEDFLGDVGGVGGVVEAARDQRVERLMILRDEDRKCLLGAGLEVGDKGRIFCRDANRAG